MNKKGFGLVQVSVLILVIFFSMLILLYASINASDSKVLPTAKADFREAYFHTVLLTILQKEPVYFSSADSISDMIVNGSKNELIYKEFKSVFDTVNLENNGFFKWSVLINDEPIDDDQHKTIKLCKAIQNRNLNTISGNVIAKNLIGLGFGISINADDPIELPYVSTTLPNNKQVKLIYCYTNSKL